MEEGFRKGSVRKAKESERNDLGKEVYGGFRKGSIRKALGREVLGRI